MWDVGPGGDAEVANLPGNPNTWIHPAYTGDGHLAIPTGGGAVTVWDTSTATQQARLTYPNPSAVAADWADDIASIAISPDGTLLAAGDGNPARAWDLTTGDELFSKSPGGWISQPAFSPDSELLALAGDSGTLSLYDREGTLRAQLRAEDGSGLHDPTFSPDGSSIAVQQFPRDRSSPDSPILLWDWRSDTTQSWPDLDGERPTYSPDGRQLAAASPVGGPAEVRDPATGDLLHALDGHTAPVVDFAYSPDGSLIATANLDGTARLWNAESGEPVLRLPKLSGEVTSVTFSPDGRHLATNTQPQGIVRVWTIDNDELLDIARQTSPGRHRRVPGVSSHPELPLIIRDPATPNARLSAVSEHCGAPRATTAGHLRHTGSPGRYSGLTGERYAPRTQAVGGTACRRCTPPTPTTRPSYRRSAVPVQHGR